MGALIAGGGIAGLTLALALSRRGVPSRVLERAKRLEETGAGVQLSPNAGHVLDGLGLSAAIDARASRPEGVRIVDAPTGRTLKRLPLGSSAERRWGAPYRVIHRADLQAVLLEAVEAAPGVELTLGAAVTGARETDGGVEAEIATADGAQIVAGDWIAGADGARSSLRRLVKLPTSVAGTGLKAWRATLPASVLPRAFDLAEVTVWLGPGAHMVVYPVRKGAEANVVVIGDDRASGPDALTSGWAAEGRELVAAGDRWTDWPLHDRLPDARVHRGRVVLLGDAAHAALPSLAQGAAFAIEDAAVLARCVAARGVAGFEDYHRARQMRTGRLQSDARRQMGIDHMSGFQALARNAALSIAPTGLLIGGLDWMYGWRDAG